MIEGCIRMTVKENEECEENKDYRVYRVNGKITEF